MNEILLQTYTIVLPIALTYIVWLLKRQKSDRDANARGTMLLLRVQLIEYHDKYTALKYIPLFLRTHMKILMKCTMPITN